MSSTIASNAMVRVVLTVGVKTIGMRVPVTG
jgi:hypothetical protein